jgi:Ca2+-transporting ATPase
MLVIERTYNLESEEAIIDDTGTRELQYIILQAHVAKSASENKVPCRKSNLSSGKIHFSLKLQLNPHYFHKKPAHFTKDQLMSSEDDRNLGDSAAYFSKVSAFSEGSLNEVEHYRLPTKDVEQIYKTDVLQGLPSSTAEDLLQIHGENTLGDDQKISLVAIVIHQTFNAMILVLIISMAIAFGIKDWISGGVIAFVVGINVGIGSYQEFKASKTMNSLKSLSSPTAKVYRDGELQTIPTKNVVPGDIVSVQVGDTIPADLRIIDCLNFETDEALLTGESLPISKDHKIVYDHVVSIGDRLNMAFSSSIVTKGRATGIAVKTGLHTEIGEIAQSLKGSRVKKRDEGNSSWKHFMILVADGIGTFLGTTVGTPLHRKLSKLALLLFAIAVVFAIIVMGTQSFKVTSQVAIYAICVALSMIPSSLVVVLTITMSVGAKTMVRRHVIIRKLDSLEALGSINDICSDKTGTLTQGKMVVRSAWVPSVGTYNVLNANEPLNPTVGDLRFQDRSPVEISKDLSEKENHHTEIEQHPVFLQWLLASTLANIATVFKDENDVWKAHGDPTEIAIQVFAHRNNLPRTKLTEGVVPEYVHLNEFPFDSSIKKMSAIYSKSSDEKENHVFTKGAVERVLTSCTKWYGLTGELQELKQSDIEVIESNMNALSSDGLRVLAFATKTISKDFDIKNRDGIEADLTFLGLVGIYDPPRVESRGAVKKCHKAGINVHMLTGDHPGTAKAIAQEVGILPHNLYHYNDDVVQSMVMTAQQFDDLSDAQIDELPVLPLVIARCSPKTKVRMIDALHRRKKFCAMTGDGVNDSPSLKKADVGIAMGISGSDVAKDASDIVLSDDNFASIINGIEEGRRMNDNIQKFVLQLLAENVAQALYLMIGLVFKDENGVSVFPLSPVEVLWVIVVTSCFPAMGLGVEAAQPDIMDRDPKPTRESVFSLEMLIDLFAYGIWMAICCLCSFLICIYVYGNGELGVDCNKGDSAVCHAVFRSRSASFATMTWCALILAWEVIDMRRSLFAMHPETETPYTEVFKNLWSNQFLFWSVILGFASVFPVVYIPVINKKVFLHGPIGVEWWVAIVMSLAFWLGCEGWKFIKRSYIKKKRVHNPEYQLEKKDPFERYTSFSRSGTMQA